MVQENTAIWSRQGSDPAVNRVAPLALVFLSKLFLNSGFHHRSFSVASEEMALRDCQKLRTVESIPFLP